MLILSHPQCAEHDPGSGHPEAPARLQAALSGARSVSGTVLQEAPMGNTRMAALAHPPAHVAAVMAQVPASGYASLDPDTIVSATSGDATLAALGAACAAVDAVLGPDHTRAFCAVRPPGHHAETDRAMGFCLFNSVAVAARHAMQAHALERVAILDFDVHHGNGTQQIFQADSRVLFASSHQFPLYPFSGGADEVGVGNLINLPLAPLTRGEEFLQHWRQTILPRVEKFVPQLILVSAGFDAHRADPLAQLELVEDDFYQLTAEIVALADDCCQGRVVSMLEGGYDLGALRDSVAAHVQAMC